MKRTLALIAALLLAAGCTKAGDVSSTGTGASSTTSATTARRSGEAHELVIGDILDLSSLNPHLASAASLGNLSELTMAYLVRYGPDNRPIPELATEVPSQANHLVSKDGRTITWHLRRGVVWSDGAPFDADDVVWTTNAVNNSANNEIGRDGWDLITKIDEPDKFTVVYHLSKPYSGFLPTYFGSAGANPCILPKHILAKLPNFNNAPYNSLPIGIGPYKYVSWQRGDRVELEANPNYWRGAPKIKRIVYRIVPDRNTLLTQLQTGEVDLWPYVGAGFYDRVRALPGVKTFRKPGYYYEHLDFNTTRPGLNDVVVRKALEYATDRETIRKKINHGTGILSETPVTPASPLHTDRPQIPYDIAKANAMLDADGWKRGADGVRSRNGTKLSFVLAVPTGSPDGDQMLELIRQNWLQVGVHFDIHRSQPALFFGPYSNGGVLYNGKWDITVFAWGLTPDGDYTPENNCDGIPPKGQNVTRLCDAQIQALLLQEKAAYDEPARKAIIAKLDARIEELDPFFVLYVRDDIHAANGALTGWNPNVTTPFDDFLNVDI